MKSAVPVISCKPWGGRPLMKCSSLHSRQLLRARSELQLMAWGGWRSLAAVQRYMHLGTEALADCVAALE